MQKITAGGEDFVTFMKVRVAPLEMVKGSRQRCHERK